MTALSDLIRHRHSERAPFDPDRPPSASAVTAILESARWAPTAHNMQNYEIVIVDDPATLAEIGRIHSGISETFLRENFAQLSFSEEELIRKGTGLLATMFPPAWRRADASPAEGRDVEHGFLDSTMRSCPMVLIVVSDVRRRAPGSEGDVLGLISLGCVMQNMWLTAASLGIGMQVMSVFSGGPVEERLHDLLAIPEHMKIAFACRIGYPAAEPGRYLRVRRPVSSFTHHNTYAASAVI